MSESFFVSGGTLRGDAPSYVLRGSDRDLLDRLIRGEYCYVLTSRQMGKSSTMSRAALGLRARGHLAVPLDLTAVGQNLSVEQWYDGLMARVGRLLDLEDALEDYWEQNQRLSPVQRFFSALGDVALPRVSESIVFFVDELDATLSLPFSSDEFFAAIRECYNRRVVDSAYARLTFCLLGVAMPNDLVSNPSATPFTVGHYVELRDFSLGEMRGLSAGFSESGASTFAVEETLGRVHHWTGGHPYLSQRLCQALAQSWHPSTEALSDTVDRTCRQIFLSSEAQYRDENLSFVRMRILGAPTELGTLLELYGRILQGEFIEDDEEDGLKNQLRLAGIVRRNDEGGLIVRNQIYRQVFDAQWIEANKPVAELVLEDGARFRLRASTSIGRMDSNDLTLRGDRVSRRHAAIRAYDKGEMWISDLGSKNGVYVNGQRITTPFLLCHGDRIALGPHRMVFEQKRPSGTAVSAEEDALGRTAIDFSGESSAT